MSKKKTSVASDCSAVAEQIATDLLTTLSSSHNWVECTRAQLMLMQQDGTEKDMGGRNKESIIKTIIPYLIRLIEL